MKLSTWNGPVPIGSVLMSPDLTLSSLTMATPLKPPMLANRFGEGWLTLISTVVSSTALTLLTAENRHEVESSSSMMRLKE